MTSTSKSLTSTQPRIVCSPQGMNRKAQQTQPRRILLNMTGDDVQLKTCQNAWRPGMRRQRPAVDPEVQKTEELLRKVRSILNKMTPERLDRLITQITELEIDTEERLGGVVDLVFEKAVAEPSFASMYGEMCCRLTALKVQSKEDGSSTVKFSSLLLRRCRAEFQKEKEGDVEIQRRKNQLDSAASEDQEIHQAKARRRAIGNVKFIGELFGRQMINVAAIISCIQKLLSDGDEESLECLCQLITTAGKGLDSKQLKLQMDQYFLQVKKIIREQKTSSRLRCLLQDLVDLRSNNWESRRPCQGPQTLQQVHKEAEQEEEESLRRAQQLLFSKNRDGGRGQRELREERERQQREARERQLREARERQLREERAKEERQRQLREERAKEERARQLREERAKEERARQLREERAKEERARQLREERERQQREERERQQREERERQHEERMKDKRSEEELSRQLDILLLEASCQQIVDWVEHNLDESQRRSTPFLRALMTSVCRSAVMVVNTKRYMDPSVMEGRLPLLVKYLQHGGHQELQAISALQALAVALRHPPYLLESFFDWLMSNDVISDEAVVNWQFSRDPEEQLGKTEALESVKFFLLGLSEKLV